jgi:HD-GYP domain-containing protein (c-di-GMP phosphodiesterase class II)
MRPPGINQQSRTRKHTFNTLYLLRIVISNTRLYSIDHPQTRKMISQAFASLKKTLRATKELNILIIDNDLIINNKAIRIEESEYFSLFINVLQEKNISHITFNHQITKIDLTHFLADLSSPEITKVTSCPGIFFGKLRLNEGPRDTLSPENHHFLNAPDIKTSEKNQELIVKLNALSGKQLTMAQELYFSIRKNQNADLRGVQDGMSSFVDLFSKNLNPLSLLTTLKTSDKYTFTHVINVCILTLAQAESLGFTEQYLYDIGITATLYDIGKTFIPEEILNKPGQLDEDEQKAIIGHSAKGAGYLLGIADAPKLAVLAALEHHIHFDGGGYPNIGQTWHTNIISQMISISDTYDAMRCSRPFRRPNSAKFIQNLLIKKKGTSFNPFLVDNFIALLARKQDLHS